MRDNRRERRIVKQLKSIKNSKAIRDERLGAIIFFCDLGEVDISVPALLQRFEYSLEHGINDTREKEDVMQGVLEFGEAALPYVREHLLKTTRIAWPIKVLKALGQEDQVIEILKDALNFEDVSFEQDAVDKNYDILCYLVDYQLPGFVPKLAHFLNDPDERVRFAATELLIEQDDPAIQDLIEPYLADHSAENTRLHQAVAAAFIKKAWTVRNAEKFAEAQGEIDNNYYVSDDGHVEEYENRQQPDSEDYEEYEFE